MEDSRTLKEKQELKLWFPSKRHGTQEKSRKEDQVKLAAIAISLKLLDSAPKPQSSLTRLARAIKKEFDSVYGPAWQCVIGTSFGSFVTHSPGGFLYFSIDSFSILLFKTEVELVTKEDSRQKL
ncbi:hypothetical protein J1N35_023694 [Gossypium stocksii]|uniref:Dynein light chain n=1 Tax=Gossypium stocksii TaxID=47602 RepID=A0A9D4A3F3_9ROSI|nr:hypothetical protein J1N35_023694 [Gossypium stocksii]